MRLAVIVPTRNRPELALDAVRSALAGTSPGDVVLVSDNSAEENRDRLEAACGELGDERVRYVAPREELGMTAHWRWAIDQALADAEMTHIAVLTDRMVFRDGELPRVRAVAAAHPGDVVSYKVDHIDDRVSPPVLIQYPWTGRSWRLDSSRILEGAASGEFPPCIPRLMNCLTPRSVLDRVAAEFGSICSSIAPDFSFAFRCLDVVDTTLHYDKSVLLAAGLEGSIGSSIVRGRLSEEGADFFRLLDTELTGSTPLPGLSAHPNPMFELYCDAMSQSSSGKLVPLDRNRYLAALANGVAVMEDPEARRRESELLTEAGWRGPRRWWGSAWRRAGELRYAAHPRDFIRRILWRRRGAMADAGRLQSRLLAALRMRPADGGGSPRLDAIAYANRNPVERVRRPVGLRRLIDSAVD